MTARAPDNNPPPTAGPQPGLDAATAPRLVDQCAAELDRLDRAGLRRSMTPGDQTGKHIERGGRRLLNLASNDYLALAQHPLLIDAACQATRRWGVGSGASRLVTGTQTLHEQAERAFAAFKHAEAALLMPSGYAANLAVLTTLAGPGDLIVLDKLVHASIIDASRASGATVRTFPHRKPDRARRLLGGHRGGRRLIVTDSVFSMDGDCADLPALCDLADQHDAVLVVDEAHGTGVLGDDGSGLARAQGVDQRVNTCGAGGVVVSTASKALGSLGGVITAAKPIIDLLVNKARPFIYSTAVPPAQAAAILAAIDVVRDEPERRERLRDAGNRIRDALGSLGWPVSPVPAPLVTPIIPLIVGSPHAALALAKRLARAGILAPAIRPPTVAPGQCRVRLSLRADMDHDDLDRLIRAIGPPTQ